MIRPANSRTFPFKNFLLRLHPVHRYLFSFVFLASFVALWFFGVYRSIDAWIFTKKRLMSPLRSDSCSENRYIPTALPATMIVQKSGENEQLSSRHAVSYDAASVDKKLLVQKDESWHKALYNNQLQQVVTELIAISSGSSLLFISCLIDKSNHAQHRENSYQEGFYKKTIKFSCVGGLGSILNFLRECKEKVPIVFIGSMSCKKRSDCLFDCSITIDAYIY